MIKETIETNKLILQPLSPENARDDLNPIYYALYHDLEQSVGIADGFFDGWPNPPSKHIHRRIMSESYLTVVAVDSRSQLVVGFLNVVSDGILAGYIPLLEVIPEYRCQGIAQRLVKMALENTKHLYMVDLACDEDLVPFYERFGMHRANAMIRRNYERQNGLS